MTGKCFRCGGPVKSGGDRHAKGACPIVGRHGEHRAARLRARRRSKGAELPKRGVVVGGLQKGGKHRKGAEKK